MTIRSREFVGIAEGIKRHELSVEDRLERLHGRELELQSRVDALSQESAYLKAAIAAALEDVDEDGDPDYSRVSALESQLEAVENEQDGVAQELSDAEEELLQARLEQSAVREEKERTLFEIQERARKTARNITLAGGMYGAYAGVGGSLQDTMQSSLKSLQNAAVILGGQVPTAPAAGISGVGGGTGGGVGIGDGLPAGGLTAFAAGAVLAAGAGSRLHPSGQETYGETGGLMGFRTGESTAGPAGTRSFRTAQSSNRYAEAAFDGPSGFCPAPGARPLESGQRPSGLERALEVASSERALRTGQMRMFVDGLKGAALLGGPPARWKKKSQDPAAVAPEAPARSRSDLKRAEFIRRLRADVTGAAGAEASTGPAAVPNEGPEIGQRERGHTAQRSGKEIERGSRTASGRSPDSALHIPEGIVGPRPPAISRVSRRHIAGQLDYQAELDHIGITLEGYRTELLAHGMHPGEGLETVISCMRYELEAELLRNMHGDFSRPVLRPDLAAVAEKAVAAGIDQYSSPPCAARSLVQTRYGFTRQVIGGVDLEVYNDPVGTASRLIRRQGESCYPISGDCGICQAGNLLWLSGAVNDISEEWILSQALHSKALKHLDLFALSGNDRGGTSAEERREFLRERGLETHLVPMLRGSGYCIRTIYEAVISGRGVILSVDVARFWRNGQRGGHAITVLSATKDGSFFLCSDTGAGTLRLISARDLADSLTGRPANITTDIIR